MNNEMNPESNTLQEAAEKRAAPPPQTALTDPLPPLSPWTHVVILTSVLAPVALVPYLAVRRHLLSLHRKLADISATNAALQRDLKAALMESAIRREEHDRLRAGLGELRRTLELMREQGHEHELARAKTEQRVLADVRDLMADREKTKAGLSHLKDLSSSLADIAAFMQEVEVQQGFVSRKNDGRGIERIRQLAYRLYNLDASNKAEKPPKKAAQKEEQKTGDGTM